MGFGDAGSYAYLSSRSGDASALLYKSALYAVKASYISSLCALKHGIFYQLLSNVAFRPLFYRVVDI